MTTKPKTRKAPGKTAIVDPVFAAITARKAAAKESIRRYRELDEAQSQAKKNTWNAAI